MTEEEAKRIDAANEQACSDMWNAAEKMNNLLAKFFESGTRSFTPEEAASLQGEATAFLMSYGIFLATKGVFLSAKTEKSDG